MTIGWLLTWIEGESLCITSKRVIEVLVEGNAAEGVGEISTLLFASAWETLIWWFREDVWVGFEGNYIGEEVGDRKVGWDGGDGDDNKGSALGTRIGEETSEELEGTIWEAKGKTCSLKMTCLLI